MNSHMLRALKPPATGKVTTQAKNIVRNNDQSTFLPSPNVHPTNTTLPTKQWVLDTGMPNFVASKTVKAAELSIVKPLQGN